MRNHNLAVTAAAVAAFAVAEAPAAGDQPYGSNQCNNNGGAQYQPPSPTGGRQAPECLPPTKEERAKELTQMLHDGIVPPFLGNTDVIGRRGRSKSFYNFRVGLAVVDFAINGQKDHYKIVSDEKKPDSVDDFSVKPIRGKHLSEAPNRLTWAPRSYHEYRFPEIVTGALARVTKRGSLATLMYSQDPTTDGFEFTVRPGHETPFKSDIVIARGR